MKGKKLLAGVLSAAMVFGTMAFPVFADDAPSADWDSEPTAKVFAYGTNSDGAFELYADTLEKALNQVYNKSPENVTTIECKADSDVGTMTHAPVSGDLIIKGNNAYVSGGEQDLNVETAAKPLDKDITVEVSELDGIAAWGERVTDKTVNITFNNCDNMCRVYISNKKDNETAKNATNNITLNNCTFDGDKGHPSTKNSSIYSNAKGNINLNSVSFTNIAVPVNLKNKSNGTQTITADNCKFTNCATTEIAETTSSTLYAAPIRVVTEGSAIASYVTVADCTFINSGSAGNGTVLLGDGRDNEISTPNVTLSISGTAAEIQVQEPNKRTTPAVKKTVTAADNEVVEMPSVAKIGEINYATLKDAIAAAKDNDVITVMGRIALPNFDFSTDAQNVTIKGADENAVLELSGAGKGTNMIFQDITMEWPNANYQGIQHSNTLVYNNVTIKGQPFLYASSETFNNCTFIQESSESYNVWTYAAKECTFNNCTFNSAGKSVLVYNEGNAGNYENVVNANGCEFNASSAVAGKSAIEVDSSLAAKGFTVNIDADPTKGDTTATGFGTGSVSGNQLYNVKKAKEGEDPKVTITVKNQDVDLKPINVLFVKKDFDKVTNTDNDEEKDVYEITLTSVSAINKLNSADLTFALENTEGGVEYTVSGTDKITVTSDNADENRYEFHYNAGDLRESSNSIVIGTVTLSGYGKYKFKVDDSKTTNVVNATTVADNLVTSYDPTGTANGKLELANATTGDQEIKVPTKQLTVKIAMNNKVEDTAIAYQDMKIEIKGANTAKTIDLGNGNGGVVQENGVYKVTEELEQNIPYTVTVSGAGYRTARYTVNLNADKTLNFWNNVMDNAIAVEEGNTAYKKNVTFLAGDIVKDNKINIYDLSAVVSYFGTDNLVTEHPEYAKYDLNRDGVIDSKDVAYVLVSWGN